MKRMTVMIKATSAHVDSLGTGVTVESVDSPMAGSWITRKEIKVIAIMMAELPIFLLSGAT